MYIYGYIILICIYIHTHIINMWKWKEGPLRCKDIHTKVNLTLFIDILLYNIWKGITFLNVLVISAQVLYSRFVLQIFACFDFYF